jgi:hypothetical protein
MISNTEFSSKMDTAAAVDRVVHHATILEFKASSYRSEQAKGHSEKSDPNHRDLPNTEKGEGDNA